MRSFILHLVRLVMPLLPETQAFGLKAALLGMAGIKLGRGVRVCSSARILGGGGLEVGDGTWIGHDVMICASSNVTIGANVDIGPRTYIGTGTHVIDPVGPRSAGVGEDRDVRIGDGAWIGAGSIVLPGTVIGEKAVIAAGSVVTSDVPPRVVAGGVPAKVLRDL
jgi:acetyltransferase-like isoleucine patch superfamily enzyme